MSPTKKKTVKKKSTAKKTAKKKTTKKKKTGKSAPAKTAKKKKTQKKTTSKKAAPKKAAGKQATSKKAAPKKAAGKQTPAKKGKKAAGAKAESAPKPVPKGKPVPLSEIPHPKYGLKFECFACDTRFYMMGRPDPICPKCGADQRERPKETAKDTPKPKRPVVRPMAPLLDDDEDVASDDLDKAARVPAEPDAMFDDAEDVSVGDDVDPVVVVVDDEED
jgi:hypothetical protein